MATASKSKDDMPENVVPTEVDERPRKERAQEERREESSILILGNFI